MELKNDIETLKWQKKRLTKENEELKQCTSYETTAAEQLESQVEQQGRQIGQLEDQKKIVQKNLKKKETDLYCQKFKIKDLQKTKQVLTHRTLEMKASLEPKEQQIESRKEQLLDLEQVFEVQNKTICGLKREIEEREQARKVLEKQLEREKIMTKKEEAKINDFTRQI